MPNPFKKPEPARHDVDGQAVCVRPMTAGEYCSIVQYEHDNPQSKWKSTFQVLSFCVYDTQGNRMFTTPAEAEDLPQEVAGKLSALCRTVNGLDVDAKKND